MVDTNDVRNFLNGVTTARIEESTIELQLEIANTTVESERGQNATTEQVDDAKLVYAAYLSLGAYAVKMERSVGGPPPNVAAQLDFLRTLAEAMMIYVRRGSPNYDTPMVAQPDTLADQYANGDLDGESY